MILLQKYLSSHHGTHDYLSMVITLTIYNDRQRTPLQKEQRNMAPHLQLEGADPQKGMKETKKKS